MKAFKLDTDGDIDTTNARMSYVTGRDAIKQKLQIALSTFLNEWFLDLRTGMPYYQNVLIKNPGSPAVASLFRKYIASCDGIVTIDSVTVSFDKRTRRMTVAYVAKTTDGSEIPVEDSFVIGAQGGGTS